MPNHGLSLLGVWLGSLHFRLLKYGMDCIFLCVDSQAGIAPPVVGGSSIGGLASHSRSEDEESTGVKDVKRSAAQAFGGGGGVPKRRSSSRFVSHRKRWPCLCLLQIHHFTFMFYHLLEAYIHSHLQCRRGRHLTYICEP